MSAQVLVDLDGAFRLDGREQALAAADAGEALAVCADAPVTLLTDWHGHSVCGVATVRGKGVNAVAMLEKQLRDSGETDEVCHLIVHQSYTRMGNTELAYTAVPLHVWRSYQHWARLHPRLVLMHDWIRALRVWARELGVANGCVAVAHRDGVDVLVLVQGRIVALERMRVYQDEASVWTNIGRRVADRLHNLPDVQPGAGALPVWLWVCGGVGDALASLEAGLSPFAVRARFTEDPVSFAEAAGPAEPWSPSQLGAMQPVKECVNGTFDRFAYFAERLAPAVGVVAFAISCVFAVMAFDLYQTRVARAQPVDSAHFQALSTRLNHTVQETAQQQRAQRKLAEWAERRLAASAQPDPYWMLARIREALPDGVLIEEFGLVSERESHLITVVGRTARVDGSLRGEELLASGLERAGFVLHQREMLLRDGQPGFKLSMMWSGS